jgi:predicted amidohydrolase
MDAGPDAGGRDDRSEHTSLAPSAGRGYHPAASAAAAMSNSLETLRKDEQATKGLRRAAAASHVRVGVVQLAYHPVVPVPSPSALEDPFGDPSREVSSLLPAGESSAPLHLQRPLKELRRRIRGAYLAQTKRKVEAILDACRKWSVQILVFPEYSIPPALLDTIARTAPDTVIVAGTHFVDDDTLEQRHYEKLGSSADHDELLGCAVSPVLHGGRLLALIPKLHPAKPELRFLQPGHGWAPIDLPESFGGPLGVLICLDLLQRESDPHREHVGPHLSQCRLIAAPSLTGKHTLPEFDAKAQEEARRKGRPVLYADHAPGGGSSIYVDEGREQDLRIFPEHAGYLEPGEEGVVVADVDLGHQAAGASTRHASTSPILPYAAASLVYSGVARARAEWHERFMAVLDEPEKNTRQRLRAAKAFIAAKPPEIPDGISARQRRLQRLMQDIEGESNLDRVRQLTREIVLPEEVLPLDGLRAALGRGAADEIQRWVNEHQAGDFGPVVTRLREPWEKLERTAASWSERARRAADEASATVRGGPKPLKESMLRQLLSTYEKDFDASQEQINEEASKLFDAGRYAEAREHYLEILRRSEEMLAAAGDAASVELKRRASRCRLNLAAIALNMQEVDEAKRLVDAVDADLLSVKARLNLAEVAALVGDLHRAEALLADKGVLEDAEQHGRIAEIGQRIAIRRGKIPPDLRTSAPIQLDATMALLSRDDLAGAAAIGLAVLESSDDDTLTAALATIALTETLVRTIFENPPRAVLVPVGRRADIIAALEKRFGALRGRELPPATRRDLDHAEEAFRGVTYDDDQLEERYAAGDGNDSEEAYDGRRRLAFRLAVDGHVDDALRTLPADPHDHPWRERLSRVELLAVGGKLDRALDEALALVSDFPGRAPIEHITAQLCDSQGRPEEALRHATLAYEQLPGKRCRLLLAGQLLVNDQAEAAWELVKDLEDDRPLVLRTRAIAAERTGHAEAAEEAWRRYVELRPKDLRARVGHAQLLFRLHRLEQAAAIAWKLYSDQRDRLDLDALYAVGSLQRLAGALDEEQTRRIKEIAERVKERFPADARAEFLRLQLLLLLGELPADRAPLDYKRLVEAGFLQARPASELAEFLHQRRAFADAVSHLVRQGAIPMSTALASSGTQLALFVTRILERRRLSSPGFLCPPVSLSDQPPALQLEGATILVSDLELLLLETLDLTVALRAALGPTGRLVLFARACDRIREDFAKLRIAAAPRKIAELETLLRQIEHLPTLEADPGAPYDDRAAARKSGAAIVDEEVRVDAQRISPRAFLSYLHDEGCIDAAQRDRIEPYLPGGPEPMVPMPDPLPARILVPWYFIEKLFQEDVLVSVFRAHRERFCIGPRTRAHFQLERDDRADTIRAEKLAERVHALLAERWIQEEREPPADVLPALRDPDEAWGEELVLEPLREMLAYRHAVLQNTTWWRLSADFFGTNALGAPGLTDMLAWKSDDEYQALMDRVSPAAARDITLPALVRSLLDRGEDADTRLLKLAELGFPDALSAAEILRLERRYRGLDKSEPKRILDNQEWMAREPGHIGGEFARIRLAQTYAGCIFHAFCNDDGSAATGRSPAEQAALARTLLVRQETMTAASMSDSLAQTLQFLLLKLLGNPLAAWKRDEDGYVTDHEGSATRLWDTIREWTGENEARRAAHDRATREAWLLLDKRGGDGASMMDALTLGFAHPPEMSKPGNVVSLIDAGEEALAILSATWKERPLEQRGVAVKNAEAQRRERLNFEQILQHGAALLTADAAAASNARSISYEMTIPGHSGVLPVRAPVEAAFLRTAGDARRGIARHLKVLQGRHDGALYELLAEIERAPTNGSALREYARRSASALFRLVRDDPPFIHAWSQTRGVSAGGMRPRIHDLLTILSEPNEPLPASLPDLLQNRLDGFWSTREDVGALFVMASEIPGFFPSAPIRWWLDHADEDYERHIDVALNRLDHPDEFPIARLAGDVIFLRLTAMSRPLVKLPEGEVDLREILPARLERLLNKVSEPPEPETLGSAEGALLRICGEVVQRLARPTILPLREGLWLTWRLFQWLCLQLDAISPDARRDGIRRLVAQAPPPAEQRDVLDPFGFGRERFDHRLATVLHALSTMEEFALLFREQQRGENAFELRSVSSPALEDKLLALARGVHLGPTLGSVLGWGAPGNIPDLALNALLHLNLRRFVDLSPESRMRRLEVLPEDSQGLKESNEAEFLFAHRVVLAAADIAEALVAKERALLEMKLRAMVDGPRVRELRWWGFVRLFAAGVDSLENEARALTIEHVSVPSAPAALGSYLLGVAARDPARVEETIDAMLAAASERGADVVALAAGALGRLVVHGKPPAQKVAGALLLRLAERSPFREDPRMDQVIGAFGLQAGTP